MFYGKPPCVRRYIRGVRVGFCGGERAKRGTREKTQPNKARSEAVKHHMVPGE